MTIRNGWKAALQSATMTFMPRVCAIAALTVLALLGGTACSEAVATARSVDDHAILPASAGSKSNFRRAYMLMTARDLDDLPFTTGGGPERLTTPRKVWVGVFVRTPSVWTSAPRGIQIVAQRDQFPQYVHGGCAVVNLVADASSGETLSSWCNIDDGATSGGPAAIPSYFAKGSPFR